jgi:hypothetical protein
MFHREPLPFGVNFPVAVRHRWNKAGHPRVFSFVDVRLKREMAMTNLTQDHAREDERGSCLKGSFRGQARGVCSAIYAKLQRISKFPCRPHRRHSLDRICTIVAVSILWLVASGSAPAVAEPSLVSAWQHCEPDKGCSKFAFMPNGWVIEQFRLAGSLVTAYGRYHVRGTVLKIGWKRFTPSEICGPAPWAAGSADGQCSLTTQSDFKGPFHFEGLNALLWLKPDGPALRLFRIEL